MSARKFQVVEPLNEERKIQKDYISRLKKLGNRTYNISTYGCQMNSRDSETVSGMLEEMGFTHIDTREEADIVVFNTCCVRENAENRLYGNLGTLKEIKRKRKNMKIILCGCMMQQDVVIDKIKESYNFVDVIFGTFNIHRLPQLLHTSIETREQIVDLWREHSEIVEDLPSQRIFPFKAGVNIMYGCDNRCSFCIVPHVRGSERSREMKDIISEIKYLVADGVVEVMLLGQNVNSYGKGLYPHVTFSQLLREVNKIDGLERIRFMSSHPKDLSDDLILAMRDCDKVCKQFHLPVQSGSSRLLAKMRRTYNIEQYMKIVDKLKEAVPEITITTDLIIGFPGETEEDNEKTIELIKKVKYSNAYTFIYSKREGTEAATMEDQIPAEIAKERFNKVVEAINPIAYEINKAQISKTLKVLVEGEAKNSMMSGRTDGGLLVHFEGSTRQIGQIVDVKIIDAKTFYLIGRQEVL